jgi:multiple sugar transport system permease protein
VVSVLWLIVLLAFAVIPMLWMLSTSLKGQFAALQQPPEWLPSRPTLANYQTLLSPTGDVGRRSCAIS